MGEIGYLGGIRRREAAGPSSAPEGDSAPAEAETWSYCREDDELFLRRHGDDPHLSTFGPIAILIRGYAVAAGSSGAPDAGRAAEDIVRHYREHGELPIDRLDGSFTLALMDGTSGRVLLYRNLVGSGFTYYAASRGGLIFGSNLAELVGTLDATGWAPGPNRNALPVFFLYRFVPGRETLFADVYRLAPGELLTFAAGRLTRSQRQTFGPLRGTSPYGRDAVDRIEETMARVIADCAAVRPDAANTLSGGVDSSYIQALWGRTAPTGGRPAVTFSVAVDHPFTRPDTDYAVSAAHALGTRHRLVAADEPYETYLVETIAATAEPPNHVQTAYFGRLARAMREEGHAAGLCGEGADSLFGLGSAAELQMAGLLRRYVPPGPIRRWGAALAARAGHRRLPGYFRLADRLDDLADPEHPVNRIAAFTDWAAATACFGEEGVAAATAYRRALLDQYEVPDDPLERLHAAGFLGEAMDSASLWTTLFNREGCDLLCPYLDARVLRLAMTIDPGYRYPPRRPKDLLKRALARHVSRGLAYRPKLGFGQPIFEWLSPGGQLRHLVDAIDDYEFLDRNVVAEARARPNWFLYNLLCYDLWHKLFIDRSLSHEAGGPTGRAPATRP